jgi:hypothetical protein
MTYKAAFAYIESFSTCGPRICNGDHAWLDATNFPLTNAEIRHVIISSTHLQGTSIVTPQLPVSS